MIKSNVKKQSIFAVFFAVLVSLFCFAFIPLNSTYALNPSYTLEDKVFLPYSFNGASLSYT